MVLGGNYLGLTLNSRNLMRHLIYVQVLYINVWCELEGVVRIRIAILRNFFYHIV